LILIPANRKRFSKMQTDVAKLNVDGSSLLPRPQESRAAFLFHEGLPGLVDASQDEKHARPRTAGRADSKGDRCDRMAIRDRSPTKPA
jgi:hypothetical protein